MSEKEAVELAKRVADQAESERMKRFQEEAKEIAREDDSKVQRLRGIIHHITNGGVYPAQVIGGENPYEKRTEWMEGWNAAMTDVLNRYRECAAPDWKPDIEEVAP